MSNVEEVLHAQICICVKTGQMLGSGESQVKTEPLITYIHLQSLTDIYIFKWEVYTTIISNRTYFCRD